MQRAANLNDRPQNCGNAKGSQNRQSNRSEDSSGESEKKLESESKKGGSLDKSFANFAKVVANASGKPITFFLACLLLIVWAVTGPTFEFNDTWQLVINTGTTIITFLMVFVIQNTQNRDMEAMQIKLDEIMQYIGDTNQAIIGAEDLSTEELGALRKRYVDSRQEHED